MPHSHELGQRRTRLLRAPRNVVIGVVAAIVPLILATVAGLIWLWPDRAGLELPANMAGDQAKGEVLSIHPCGGDQPDCRAAEVKLGSGKGAPGTVSALLPFGPKAPKIKVGDRVMLSYHDKAPADQRYAFQDFDRIRPLTWLLAAFVVAVLLISRGRGVGALLSLGFTLALIVYFTLPALIQGGPALPIAVVTAAAAMIATLFLSHGINLETCVAMIGTLISLTITAILGTLVIGHGHFTGFADEGSQYIAAIADQIDLSGLLLAGLVIGALGVLDDVTVTQVAAVWELADADPDASRASLFVRSMRIGRSHVASTVNTLALAYAGAMLPMLMVFSALELPFTWAASLEMVAQEIARGLVGGLGIIAAVPITTAIAAVVVATLLPTHLPTQPPDERLRDE